jgi:hypothetical protein
LIGVALVAFNNYVKHQVSFHFKLIRKTFNYYFCFYVVSTLFLRCFYVVSTLFLR